MEENGDREEEREEIREEEEEQEEEEKKENREFEEVIRDEERKTSKIADKVVGFLFNKKNFYMILIIILALVLRLIVATNVGPLADEMNVGVRSIDIHKSGTMNSIDQSHSFYYLNEIIYKLTGNVNLLTARFTSILFGILSILMIYLIVMKLYKSKKIALISSFLVAVSGYQIRLSLAEMDITMAFFVLLSSYAFLLAIYNKKDYMYYLSAVFLGLAVSIKTFAGVWVLSYAAFALYYSFRNKEYKREYLSKKGIKIIIVCAIIIFVFVAPIIIANYLLYKDKGIVDAQIARFFNINREYYAGLGGVESPFMLSQLSTGLMAGFSAFWRFDAIISILAVLGFLITFKKYKDENLFLFFWFIFIFLFISGTAWLETHFVFNTLIFSVFAALFLVEINKIVIKDFNFKKFIAIALIIILVVNIWVLLPHITSKTAITKMRSFAIDNIDDKSLVIVDARVFRGRMAFMFNDKHYLESTLLESIQQQEANLPGEPGSVKTYYIECAPDDCGWGTIKNQPEFNQTNEGISKVFRDLAQTTTTIYGGGGNAEAKGEPYFYVYEMNLVLKPAIVRLVENTHNFFLYPVGWWQAPYDKYQIHNAFDQILNKVGFLIFYIIIGLEILSPFAMIWFFKKYRHEEE